jgi:hypothetical protein
MFLRDSRGNYAYFALAIAVIIFGIRARIVEIKAFISP